MILGLILSVVGLVVLAFAADQFVMGAARMAVALRIAPVVVGAVVIGFGTSAPEMVVSGLAAGRGELDIGAGNVIGSNVANISLVLGVAALISGIRVHSVTLKREAPLSVASVAVFAWAVQGELHRWESICLLVGLVVALGVVVGTARRGDELAEDVVDLVGDARPDVFRESLRVVIGLLLVVGSATMLVEGAERVAEDLELTGGFVGFTLVAVGTSAPELVTSVAAARRGEPDLLVGNVLGSNVFNSLAVGGVMGVVGPGPVLDTTLTGTGSLLMLVICVVSWVVMMIGGKLSRRDGVLLLVLWIAAVVVLAGGADETASMMGIG